jgi:uncharacterized alpha-E superfamily protein
MLSRVADGLFWMSRYLERAEHVARLLDVCFHQELDLHGVLAAGPHELQWTSLAAILQQQMPVQNGSTASPRDALSRWLTFDLTNPDSIMSCVARARANARSVRGSINAQVWRELNKLHLQLSDPVFRSQAGESPHEYYQAVECGGCLFQGICDATLSHDEGWQFIQLGKYLERADKTVRILDIQYQLLQDLNTPADLPLANLLWGGVLRGCGAYEGYQRIYVGRIEPEHVVEFLLLHPQFPRSVRFCLEAAAGALAAIEGLAPGRELSAADRELSLVLGELRFRDLEQILAGDLHVFLSSLERRCGGVSRALQRRYSLR